MLFETGSRSPGSNRLRDVGLSAHGVDRDDAPFERERAQQFGNGGFLVRFPGGRPLSEDQSCARREGTDQMQGRGIHPT